MQSPAKTSSHSLMTGHRALRDFAFAGLGNWAALEEKAAHLTFLKGALG